MESAIRDRVLLLNPWFETPETFAAEVRRRLPNPFVPRDIDTSGFDDDTRAKLVVGPRQAGKSTWIWSWIQDRRPEEVLVLNAEEALIRRWAESPVQVVSDITRELPAVRTIFVEEAQHLDEAGLFLKGLVDARRGFDILATGSSSFHLESRTRESLAGRAVRRRLLPLSLEELLRFEGSPVPAVRTGQARRILDRQQVVGGYPGVWFHADPAMALSDLVEAFVLRDASDRFRIQQPEAFRRLLELAAGQIGQMASYAEWASLLGVAANTVRDWLGLLEESWILRRLPPFAGGKRLEITGAPRVHFFDIGVRNRLLGALGGDIARRPDRGALAEGWAYGELAKTVPPDWTIHYWRTKGGAELDFVIAQGERVVGVEIKAGKRVALSRSVRSFIDAYSPEVVVLASQALEEPVEQRIGRTRVLAVPLSDLSRAVRTATMGAD